MFRRPSLGFAEIAWRWSFGAAAGLLILFSFFEYLDTLPVTRADLLLLRTRHPALISQVIAHIFRGSGSRVVETIIVLAAALSLGWMGIAGLARAATLKALLSYFGERGEFMRSSSEKWLVGERVCRVRSLFGLNFFRVGVALAATVGCLAAFLVGGAASSTENPSPATAFLIAMSLCLLVWLIWSCLNWLLSLAAIEVVANGRDTFGAIASAVDLCRARLGPIAAVGTWFGLAHIAAFVVATSLVAFPLGLGSILPAAVVVGGVLLITLVYFAVVDFLYMGRLAAYVAILESPGLPIPQAPLPVFPGDGESAHMLVAPTGIVDREELILSDHPVQP